jgi:hypothetical protein
MVGLNNCNVVSSVYRITCDNVSFFMEDTLQKSSNIFTWFFITSPVTSSSTICPSVYISMVHHDNIDVFSFDRIFVCGYVLSWCMCVRMCTHAGQWYFLYLEWKRQLRCHSGRQRKYGSFGWGKSLIFFLVWGYGGGIFISYKDLGCFG